MGARRGKRAWRRHGERIENAMDFVRGVAMNTHGSLVLHRNMIMMNTLLLDDPHPTPFPLKDKEARADDASRSFKPSKSATASWKTPNLG